MPEKIKTFTLRLTKKTWLFVKQKAAQQDMPMNDLINKLIANYKNKSEKLLTVDEVNV